MLNQKKKKPVQVLIMFEPNRKQIIFKIRKIHPGYDK